jgi:LysR family nitrogen assimilation transcriptional regulator
MRERNTRSPALRDLTQLASFVRVAELGSFTKAGATLGVAQPALSRQVRSLEVALKANLFRRNGRGVVLTEAGRRFLEHAQAILHGVDAAVQSVRGEGAVRGRVAIGLPPSVGKVMTLPLVARFVSAFPEAALAVVEGLSATLQEQLVSGRLDLAVLFDPAPSPHIAAEPLATEPLYVIGPRAIGRRGASVRLAELEGVPLIFPGAPHPMRSMIEGEAARTGVKLKVVLEIDAVGAILDLVESGYGHSVVPKNVLRAELGLRRTTWQRLDAAALTTTLCLATSARRPASRVVLETATLVRAVLGHALKAKDPAPRRRLAATARQIAK